MITFPTNKGIIWASITCLIVAISGCTAQVSLTREITPASPLPTLVTSSTPFTITLPSVVWQPGFVTFTDSVLGVALDVPSDWSIHPRTEPAAKWSRPSILSSPCISKAPIVLPPCTQIQISPGSASVHSLNEVRERSIPAGTKILAERQINLHGLPALWIETETGESDTSPKFPTIWVDVLVNDHSVALTAYGDLTPVTDIVSSIRPTNK